jgi:hypothetical protein
MKIKIAQIIEIVLGGMFICGYFLSHYNVVNLHAITYVASSALGTMYFPLGFYTLKSEKFSVVFSILFGILFSISLIAIMFSLMQLAISIILLISLPSIFLIVAGMQAFIFYFITKKDEYQILFNDKLLTIRYLVLFVLMLFSLFTYDFRVNM